MNEYQICVKCKKVKKLNNFRYRGGLQSWCKFCAGLKGDPEYLDISNKEAVEKLEYVTHKLSNMDEVPMGVIGQIINVKEHLKKEDVRIINQRGEK